MSVHSQNENQKQPNCTIHLPLTGLQRRLVKSAQDTLKNKGLDAVLLHRSASYLTYPPQEREREKEIKLKEGTMVGGCETGELRKKREQRE